MRGEKVSKLGHGLYVIFWKSGGLSVAAVGSDRYGNRWFAPTNWISVPTFDWSLVKSVEMITDQDDMERYYGDNN